MKTSKDRLETAIQRITEEKDYFLKNSFHLKDLQEACKNLESLAKNISLAREVLDRLGQVRTKSNLLEAVKELPLYELPDNMNKYSTTTYISDASMVLDRRAIKHKKLLATGTGDLSDYTFLTALEKHFGTGADKDFVFKTVYGDINGVFAIFADNAGKSFVINASMLRLLGTAFGTAGVFTFTQKQKHKLITVRLNSNIVAYIMPVQTKED